MHELRDFLAAWDAGKRGAELDRYVRSVRESIALHPVERDCQQVTELKARVAELESALSSPHIEDFLYAVKVEAIYQREHWGSEHDAGKEPQDWFWLLGYLAGKALKAAVMGERDKALHHTVSSAAALLNWHAHITGSSTGQKEHPLTQLPQAEADRIRPLTAESIREAIDRGNRERLEADRGAVSTRLPPE